MFNYDGQNYNSESEKPDLGSLRCIGVDGNQRYYAGKYEDRYKLPKYDNLATGSDATLVDNGNLIYFLYEETEKKWHGNGEVI